MTKCVVAQLHVESVNLTYGAYSECTIGQNETNHLS